MHKVFLLDIIFFCFPQEITFASLLLVAFKHLVLTASTGLQFVCELYIFN